VPRPAANASADVQLPGIISDHMVLQRDALARIFGKASPGESVTDAFRGQTARAVTDPLGRWDPGGSRSRRVPPPR
jgi:sialate O-acetylesterase